MGKIIVIGAIVLTVVDLVTGASPAGRITTLAILVLGLVTCILEAQNDRY